MEKEKKKKQLNFSVEFWRFFFTISIAGYHVGTTFARGRGLDTSVWFFGASEILTVFLIFSGFFIMSSFRKRKESGVDADLPPRTQAWNYLKEKLKQLMPIFIIGQLLGFFATCLLLKYPLTDWPMLFVNSIWEFTGLSISGLGMGSQSSGLFYSGTVGTVTGTMGHFMWNQPLWYISGLLISSYVIYYLLAKNEDRFLGFTAPVLYVVISAYWYINGFRAAFAATTFGGYFNSGLIFMFITISLGCLVYLLVDKHKDKKFSGAGKFGLTLLSVAVAATLVVFTLRSDLLNLDRYTLHALSMILATLALLNKDYLSKLLNLKVFGYLGRLSIYIFVVHYPITYFVYTIYAFENVYHLMIVVFIFAILFAILLKLIVEEVINPLLFPKKKSIKS